LDHFDELYYYIFLKINFHEHLLSNNHAVFMFLSFYFVKKAVAALLAGIVVFSIKNRTKLLTRYEDRTKAEENQKGCPPGYLHPCIK